METKPESATVWNQSGNTDSADATQVHFEGGTVAQIVYSGDGSDQARGQQQQVVYTADGNSYTSVESAEHTLVYIHPANATQAVFADQPQVAYIQQDGTSQQVAVLLPSGQNVNTASLHVLSNVAEAPQSALEPAAQEHLPVSNSLASMADMADSSSSPLGVMDTTDDSEEEDDDEDDLDIVDWEPRQRFNPHNLWCEECNNANTSDCLNHGPLHPIPNRPVMSKARASLPLILYIDRFLGGVFSKRYIPKRTQFGPVDGPLVPQSELGENYIHLKLCILDAEKNCEKSQDSWLDLSDEDSCNWMMFIRPAQNHLEQNLVAYQYGPDIFYTTIKNIEPKQELKVWYAATYAEFVNQKLHSVTEEERKVLRELEKNWPCYECSRRFVSSEQLQQHLNMHDNLIQSVSRSKGRGRARGRKRFGTSRRPGRPPKFIRLDAPVEDEVEKTTDVIDLAEAQPLDEPTETVQNGVEVTVSEPDTETEGQTAPSAAAAASGAPPPCMDPPPKEELVQSDQSEAQLPSPDVRRLKRMRNASLQHLFIRKTFRPFKCKHCEKAFRDRDKLEQHLRVHGRNSFLFPCHLCNKTFLTDTALDDHLLVHAGNRAHPCLLCTDIFDGADALKDHLEVHVVDGNFTCPSCKKTFPDFIQVKKHMRCFHSEKLFPCPNCEKAFCRPDKLRLHMLRHSDRRDFLCSTCGKQFKRKDKLREHMQRMHNPEREAKKAERSHRAKSQKMKIPTNDFESFMFKCRLCMMGFRRRGMLVNHLSKRHPDMRVNDVPELTLPIIKPNRDYYCQYCDKVYKSASKRKSHILKNHPGSELPPSIRKLRPAAPGEPDPMLTTHTQLAGTIAYAPVCCPHCAKQYSSKTKMVQHIRKKHPEFAQHVHNIQTQLPTTIINNTPPVISADGGAAEAVVTTDLLTQAMTELSQTLTTDYRTPQGDYQRIQYIPVSQAGGNLSQQQHIQLQVVHVAPAPSPHSQQQAVDVNQLHDPNGYSQHAIQVQQIQVAEPSAPGQGIDQVTGPPLSPNSQETNQELSPTQLAPNQNLQSGGPAQQQTPQQQQQQQQQGAVQHAYIQSGNWNYRGYPSEIQMMTLPQTQYVITEATAPAPGPDSNQVKTTHYVISDGQTELDPSKASSPPSAGPNPVEQLEAPASRQSTTQYIITTTTDGTGASQVRITKPGATGLVPMPQLMLGGHAGARAALDRAHRRGPLAEPVQNNLEKTHSSPQTSGDLPTPSTSSLSPSRGKRSRTLVFAICGTSLLLFAVSIYLEKVSWLAASLYLTLGVCGYLLLSYFRSAHQREPTPAVREEVPTQRGMIVDERSPSPDVKRSGVSVPLALALADSLLLSVLQEPLADPSGPRVQDLLSRLESTFHTLESVYERSESREEDRVLMEKVTLVQSYLHKRSSSLRRLLKVQAEYESRVKELRGGVVENWGQLEELHTAVTLTNQGAENRVDLASAHQDAETLFAVLSHHREQLEGCQDLLKDSTQLLQELIWSHGHAGNTLKNCSSESVWPEMLLQSNMEQLDEVRENFLSLEQQTATFQAHLKGLAVGKEASGAPSPEPAGKIPPENLDSDDDSDARKSLCERSAQRLSSTMGRLRKSGKKTKLIGH